MSEDAKIIPFPRREQAVIAAQVSGDNLVVDCSSVVHVFDIVPGRCKCGENFWYPPNEPRPV